MAGAEDVERCCGCERDNACTGWLDWIMAKGEFALLARVDRLLYPRSVASFEAGLAATAALLTCSSRRCTLQLRVRAVPLPCARAAARGEGWRRLQTRQSGSMGLQLRRCCCLPLQRLVGRKLMKLLTLLTELIVCSCWPHQASPWTTAGRTARTRTASSPRARCSCCMYARPSGCIWLIDTGASPRGGRNFCPSARCGRRFACFSGRCAWQPRCCSGSRGGRASRCSCSRRSHGAPADQQPRYLRVGGGDDGDAGALR